MTTTHTPKNIVEIEGTPFWYDAAIQDEIDQLENRVNELSTDQPTERATREIVADMKREFVRQTSTIASDQTCVSTSAQTEAKNLENVTQALNLVEALAESPDEPIRLWDINQIHRRLFEGQPEDIPSGYRKGDAPIAGARYRTIDPSLIDWNMRELIGWLGPVSVSQRLNAIATASAAHIEFTQIHPFEDGNGRTARLLMVLILRRAGYPIAIVTRDHRERYYAALDAADEDGNISQFVSLLTALLSDGLSRFESAAEEQRQQEQAALDIAERMARKDIPILQDEYTIWTDAFISLRSKFHSMVKDIDRNLIGGTVRMQSFDMADFEKFADLYMHKPRRKQGTWFFRIDIRTRNTTARYSFTFRWSDSAVSDHSPISLRLGREEAPNRFMWLDEIPRTNVPRLFEIAFSGATGKFVYMNDKQRVEESTEDDIVKRFFDEVTRCHFRN